MHGKAEHRGLQPPARAGNVTCRTCIVALAALVLTGLHGVADSFVPAAFTAIHVRAGLGRLAHSTGGARRAPHGGASATSCRAHAVALRMQSDGAASPPPPPRGPGGSAGGPNVGVGGSGWSRPTDVQGKGSGQLGPTLGQIMARKRQLAAGGLRQLPRVYPADEILNRAINTALHVKEDTSVKNSRQRARKWGAERLQTLSLGLTKPTGDILKGYDRILKSLSPFEKVVADLTMKARQLSGYGSFQDTIEGLRQLRKDSLAICRAATQAAKNAASRALADAEVDAGINAVEELWERDGWVLDLLLDMGKELRSVPMIDPELPTVVLIGSPNVGKSSIVRSISTGTPEISNYPFTTRGMTLGHIMSPEGERLCQVMDTPGLLPRRDTERNEMEMLTLASMQHLQSVAIFVMDLTGESGSKSSVDAQLAVRKELQIRFPDKEWMDVVSKADLTLSADVEARIPEGAVRISSKTKDGMRELMKWIGAALERSETAQAERAARLQYEKEAKRGFR